MFSALENFDINMWYDSLKYEYGEVKIKSEK